ncbi:hypothetical protein Csa_016613 [Cucumis sativus]|uniref:Transmembrane protein n=1 Tax=Cucumis sativus TaxID=3659 RepID=A0A0A0K580_CUCSA|nr:hypothetical protein Csa_016613 [Cucumis sativus]
MGAIIKYLVSIALVATLLLLSKPVSTFVVDHEEISNSNNIMLLRKSLQVTDGHQIANGYQNSLKDEDTKKDEHKEPPKKAHCPNKKSLANRGGTMLFGVGSLLCFSIVYGLFI